MLFEKGFEISFRFLYATVFNYYIRSNVFFIFGFQINFLLNFILFQSIIEGSLVNKLTLVYPLRILETSLGSAIFLLHELKNLN